MNIITDSTLLTENVNVEVDGKKTWFIEGVYIQPDVVLINRRIYPSSVMDKAVGSYVEEYVKPGRALGELIHPDNLVVNLDRVALKIESLQKSGTEWVGKARVLNTPCGKTIQALLEGGVKIGVSTRGAGALGKNNQGIPVVEDYKLVAIDAVYSPSAPRAFVQGLMEGVENIWDQSERDIVFLESIRDEVKQANRRQLEAVQLKVFSEFMSRLTG